MRSSVWPLGDTGGVLFHRSPRGRRNSENSGSCHCYQLDSARLLPPGAQSEDHRGDRLARALASPSLPGGGSPLEGEKRDVQAFSAKFS